MSKKPISFDLQPPNDLELAITIGKREQTLHLTPFVLSDEKWLAGFLEGKDIFGTEDDDPARAAGVFCYKLRREDFETLRKEMKLQSGFDWKAIGQELCDKLTSKNVYPLQQALMMMRAECLPDLPDPEAEEKGDADLALGKLIWTGMLFFAFGILVGSVLWTDYWDSLADSFMRW